MPLDVRRFELPYAARVGTLTSPALGIASIVRPGGERAGHRARVRLIDAADHRLLRAGVWLAQRDIDGVADWYLAAGAWTPRLPDETVTMGEDLPQAYADLVAPFARASSLETVAQLDCVREVFELRDAARRPLAILRSDAVTITVGDIVTSRHREVTLTPTEGLDAAQMAWVTDALELAGATWVAEFPPLVARLGAPATGTPDVAPETPAVSGTTLAEHVAGRLAAHLTTLVTLELDARAQLPGAAYALADQLTRVARDLRGLVPLIDEDWTAVMIADLTTVADRLLADDVAVLDETVHRAAMERLVARRRTPGVGESEAGASLNTLLDIRLDELRRRMKKLRVDAPEARWLQAARAAEAAYATVGVQPRSTKALRRIAKRTHRLSRRLTDCARVTEPDPSGLTAAEAFALGRHHERELAAQQRRRARVIERWTPRVRRLRAPKRGER